MSSRMLVEVDLSSLEEFHALLQKIARNHRGEAIHIKIEEDLVITVDRHENKDCPCPASDMLNLVALMSQVVASVEDATPEDAYRNLMQAVAMTVHYHFDGRHSSDDVVHGASFEMVDSSSTDVPVVMPRNEVKS